MSGLTDAAGLQEQFLNHVRREKSGLSLFLLKGLRLEGLVSGFDAYSLTLRRGATEQLVYKQAVSSIVGAFEWAPTESTHPAEASDRQNDFLLRRHGSEVKIYLVNGIGLAGTLLAHDNFCLLLASGKERQLLFKHAIATVVDAREVQR